MAQHGGRPSGCNVETEAVGGVISLLRPRPGAARRHNHYIETPLRPPSDWPGPKDCDDSGSGSDASLAGPEAPASRTKEGLAPVTSQPSATLAQGEKGATTAGATAHSPVPAVHADSIICQRCGRCKCESCRSRKRLPAKWICHDKYLCSADNCIDYCSCLCCVKGLFYHLAKDYEADDDVSCADRPCSCLPQERCPRWSCLALSSLLLPCLCCYWPLRGCLKTTETCYAAYSGRGCRCATEKTPDKLLLDTNSDC